MTGPRSTGLGGPFVVRPPFCVLRGMCKAEAGPARGLIWRKVWRDAGV